LALEGRARQGMEAAGELRRSARRSDAAHEPVSKGAIGPGGQARDEINCAAEAMGDRSASLCRAGMDRGIREALFGLSGVTRNWKNPVGE